MNPREMEKTLTPLVGAEIAAALYRVAEAHKNIGAFTVSIPSGALVMIAEAFAEKASCRAD